MSIKATRTIKDVSSLQHAARQWVETLEGRVLLAGDLAHFGPEPDSGMGPGTPAVGASAGITGWTLLAQDGSAIGTFSTGATINLRTLSTQKLNIRADTAGAQVTGVTFALDGTSGVRTDTDGDFTLFADGTNWTPTIGTHTIFATPILPGGAAGHSTAVQVTFVDQASSQALGTSATSLDFGQVNVADPAGVKQVTLSNSSNNGPITITSITFSGGNSGDFSSDLSTPTIVSPGQSITVNVSFAPGDTGNRASTMIVNHSGTNSPLSIALTGVGSGPSQSPLRPTVTSSTPSDGATGVRTDQPITINLSLPHGALDPSTVTSTNVILLKATDNSVVPATVSVSGQSIVVTPTGSLAATTPYTVQLSDNVRDVSGAALVADAINFTTGDATVSTQGRSVIDLDPSWRFIKSDVAGAQATNFDDSSWTSLSLPYTWNVSDGSDGNGKFYQGVGWFRRHITPDSSLSGQELFITFEGAFLKTDVYVNGTLVGSHSGGFAAFTFDVTSAMKVGQDNVIAVKVDNSDDNNIAPIDADDVVENGPDFTFFGGLYRGVELTATNPVHVTLTDFSSPGVFITQNNVSNSSATVQVLSELRNDSGSSRTVTVTTKVLDASGNVVQTMSDDHTIDPDSEQDVTQNTTISNPHLWNGTKDPYMYSVVVTVNSNGAALDTMTQPLGIRYFRVDPNQGFFLNGQPYDLHGVAYHQDEEGEGWAKSDADTDRDVALMQEMGVDYVRLVHYQHAQHTYDDMDAAGIIVWTEIPWIYDTTNSAAFKADLQQQLTELIKQNYNHPSVMFWGLFNGIEDTSVNRTEATALNDMAHELDPQRLTTGVTVTRVGNDAQTNFIPDLIAYNDYFGWYRGTFSDFGPYADDFHDNHPDQPFGVSEFGAGGNVNQHTESTSEPNAKGDFHPEEYQDLFNEAEWEQMKNRSYLWTKTIFSMFDFASDDRTEGGEPGLNDKGMVTYDRQTKKDSFYFYKSNWTSTPTVYITSRRYTNRPDDNTDIKIYSNLGQVQLIVNGVSMGTKTGSDIDVFKWASVNLHSGSNTIQAIGTKDGQPVTDSVTWTAP